MAINSVGFLIFCIAVLIIYYIVPKKIKWIVLLLSSYAFYFFSSGYLIVFLLLSTLSIYLSTILMDGKDKKKKKIIVLFSVLFNVLMLFSLKYLNFFLSTFKLKGIMKIAIPLGISYYTLQAIGYTMDVYRGKYKPEKNYFKLSLFLSYFPLITEGPISRYDKLSKELFEGQKLEYEDLRHGFVLVLFGYFKKNGYCR